jgi:hypothetical protein
MSEKERKEKAARYREQAKACSEWSQRMRSPTAREEYARLAREWEALAKELDPS